MAVLPRWAKNPAFSGAPDFFPKCSGAAEIVHHKALPMNHIYHYYFR
jgi:hypothetical protein